MEPKKQTHNNVSKCLLTMSFLPSFLFTPDLVFTTYLAQLQRVSTPFIRIALLNGTKKSSCNWCYFSEYFSELCHHSLHHFIQLVVRTLKVEHTLQLIQVFQMKRQLKKNVFLSYLIKIYLLNCKNPVYKISILTNWLDVQNSWDCECIRTSRVGLHYKMWKQSKGE